MPNFSSARTVLKAAMKLSSLASLGVDRRPLNFPADPLNCIFNDPSLAVGQLPVHSAVIGLFGLHGHNVPSGELGRERAHVEKQIPEFINNMWRWSPSDDYCLKSFPVFSGQVIFLM